MPAFFDELEQSSQFDKNCMTHFIKNDHLIKFYICSEEFYIIDYTNRQKREKNDIKNKNSKEINCNKKHGKYMRKS